MTENIVVALITSLVGGLSVAIVNHLLTRSRTAAETTKLLAEAEKTRAETERIKVEIQKLSNTVEEVRERVIGTFRLPPNKSIVVTETEQTIRGLQ